MVLLKLINQYILMVCLFYKMKIVLLCFLVFTSSALLAQKKYTLKECVELAIQYNNTVQQATVEVAQAQLNYNQLDLSRYPTLNAGVNSGINFGRNINPTTNQFENNTVAFNTIGLQTSVDIFNWFSKKYQRQGARLDVEASKLAVTKAGEDIALNVAIAYIQILLAKEQLKQVSLQIEQRKRQIDITQKKVNAGVLPEINVLEFQTNLATDSAQYYSSIANIDNALLRMQQVINIPVSNGFDVTQVDANNIPVVDIALLQPESVYALALKNLPQQKLNEVRYKAQEKKIESAKRAYYPIISLNGSLGTNYANNTFNAPFYTTTNTYNPTPLKVNVNGSDYIIEQPEQVLAGFRTIKAPAYFTQLNTNFRQSIGVNITVPIFNGGITKLNILRSKLALYNITLAKQQDNLKLQQDVHKAYTDALNAQRQYTALIQATNLAERTFELANKRYDLGLINNFDISTAQNNLFAARLKQLYAQYDYIFKIKLLEFYKGEGITLEKK
jgi:outer membrane protein